MAVRNAPETSKNRAWLVTASLVVLFVVALFLRAYWNLDAAHPEDGKFVLSGGSDPYYHKRAIDAILSDTGEGKFRTLIEDPLLNYPYGSVNPNPPLYQWTVAVVGNWLSGMFSPQTAADGTVLSAEDVSTWYVMLWAPAVFGALTLFPIYFIAKSLFDWRAGLVAAALWAVSTSAVDATGLGLSDHDAMLMFFATLAFLFYIKTVEQFRGDGNWIRTWRDGSAISSGLGALLRERRAGFMYALLSGISIGALALVWKGFPYVVGIIFVYAVLQLVIDHWRNRDSTGLFVATALAILVGTLMALPYYEAAGVGNFITPVFYVVAAFVLIGLVLVPTRDLPTILVMPAALIVGLLLVLVALFVVEDVAQKLLHATVYFKQSTLYTTIAEAHPADFATIAFGIGPLPFFLALAGWFVTLFAVRKSPTRALLFALVWGAVALYMAGSAVRFLFNAIPVFAVFGAFMLVWIVDWMDFGSVRRSMAGNGVWGGLRKGLRPLHITGVILLAFLLVVPNAFLAADAALPRSEEIKICEDLADSAEDARDVCRVGSREGTLGQRLVLERFGAYGQSFLSDEWRDALMWLDAHDANVTDPAQRGAFLSWWDYGHWAIAVGRHPAVADNFQNGYEYAANFLLSQNETHAVQLLAARNLGLFTDAPDAISQYNEALATVKPLLGEAGVPAEAQEQTFRELFGCPTGAPGCPTGEAAFRFAPALGDVAKATKFLDLVEKATCGTEHGCKKIRYFTTDIRMMPLDDPSTAVVNTVGDSRWQEQSSIYYAPITLANRRADDYVALKIDLNGRYVTQEEYREAASNPVGRVVPGGERLEYQSAFFNSMYWRGFAGTPVAQQAPGQPILGDAAYEGLVCALPGYGLEHFRLVYANSEIKILEYYQGATVAGTVTEGGRVAADVTVTAYDDAGKLLYGGSARPAACPAETLTGDVPHDSATTDALGKFELTAPFALPGGNVTLVASRAGVELGRVAMPITRDMAQQGVRIDAVDIAVELGSVEANVFVDANSNGVYDAQNDTLAEGVTVVIAQQTGTTDTGGNVTITQVPGGRQTVALQSDRYEIAAGSSVEVRPGAPTQHSIALREKSAALKGTVAQADGTPAESVVLVFEPTGTTGTRQTAFADENGNYTVSLRPGEYRVNVTGYSVEPATLTVAPGDDRTQDFVATRVEGG